MPKPLELCLSSQQRAELEAIREHDPRPYLRERAAGLLKIAAGQSGRQVALHGLLKAREPDAVYRWVKQYRERGVAGLEIQGRGRKPAFSP
jgi:transposase